MERLFVAAWPDGTVASALRRLPQDDERGVRWVPPAQWHVTLRFLGSCDAGAVVDRLRGATLPGCTARLGPSVDWLGPSLVVPVSGVDGLAAAVHAATEGLGEPPGRRFRGHLTIARTRRSATPSLLGHAVSGAFEVREVALVRSELTSDGPRYSTVATFPTV